MHFRFELLLSLAAEPGGNSALAQVLRRVGRARAGGGAGRLGGARGADLGAPPPGLEAIPVK